VWRGIRRSALAPDGSAAVLGSGSMGLLHLLVLRAAFPEARVLMVDKDRARLDLAARLGSMAVAGPGEAALEAALNLSDGLGVDAVFDTVGGGGALATGLALTRPGGSVVLFAHAPPDQSAAIDINTLFRSERRVLGTYSGALAEQRDVFTWLCDGSLDPSPLVTHRLPLDDFDAGVQLAMNRKALKILFTPSRVAAGQ